MRLFFRPLVVFLLALTAASASAQSPDSAKTAAAPTPETEAADAVSLAASLAAYGRRTGSAQALVTAAAILIDHPAVVGELPGDGESAEDEPAEAPLDVAALLDEAARLARSDAEVGQQIAALLARPLASAPGPVRGATRGPVRYGAAAPANGQRRHTLTFDGRETATLHLIGNGASDLDYYLYDINGDMVAFDEGPSDTATLFWYVPYRQQLTLRVRNRGASRNGYHIVTN